MIEQISIFFNTDMIYMWANIGVLPLWFIMLFFPKSNICNFFVLSIVPYIIFSFVYVYLAYFYFVSGYDFFENFSLYLNLNELKNLFSDEAFLIVFWIHFLAVNLFCGSWIVKDSQRLMISKNFIFIPLVLTYFVGPFGVLIYWLIRIFFAKKISLFD